MAKGEGQKLISVEMVGSYTAVYIGYLRGNKPVGRKRFANAVCRQIHGEIDTAYPVMIATYDLCPPIWAIPMVVGACIGVPFVAIADRESEEGTCYIVYDQANPYRAGENIQNPDPDPAWRAKQQSHAVRTA